MDNFGQIFAQTSLKNIYIILSNSHILAIHFDKFSSLVIEIHHTSIDTLLGGITVKQVSLWFSNKRTRTRTTKKKNQESAEQNAQQKQSIPSPNSDEKNPKILSKSCVEHSSNLGIVKHNASEQVPFTAKMISPNNAEASQNFPIESSYLPRSIVNYHNSNSMLSSSNIQHQPICSMTSSQVNPLTLYKYQTASRENVVNIANISPPWSHNDVPNLINKQRIPIQNNSKCLKGENYCTSTQIHSPTTDNLLKTPQ